jgi:protein-S-isoprenylcysteine O-methyltransferase Ste14
MVAITIRISLIISAYLLVCALGYLGFLTYRQNLMGWYLILTAFAYALGGPYLIISQMKRGPIIRQESQNHSFWMVIPGFLAVYYASPIEYLYTQEIIPRTGLMQTAGLVLIFFSLVLFIWARFTLRGMYSGRVEVKADHVIIRQGPYKVIRHPAYAAYILMGLGLSIGYSSLVGLLALPFLLVPALVYRMNVEEKILSTVFNEQYSQYTKKTKKLIPGLW